MWELFSVKVCPIYHVHLKKDVPFKSILAAVINYYIEKEAAMPEDKKTYQELFYELNQYEKRGVYMEMEGNQASPTQIVKAHMVRENCVYMRDYVLDETGDIIALYFNHLKE